MEYLYTKSLHIIFVVSWFSGLFYLVRLFIYHTEANARPETERQVLQKQYEIMERRLWNIITTPAMILTLCSGLYMVYLNPILLEQNWMRVKLCFVIGLLVYHYLCSKMMWQLKNGRFRFNSMQLRFWNEIATLFLVAVVFLAVLKNAVSWLWGLAGFLLFAILIMLAVKMYKSFRSKD